MQPDETWVFLRGLGRESGHWGSFLIQFQKQFPKAKIITCDLPGTGKNLYLQSPIAISEMWDFVLDELKRNQVTEKPWNILAVSLGAMVAAFGLSANAKNLQKIALVNTSFSISPFYHRLQPKNYIRFLKIALSFNPTARELEVLRMISQRPEKYESTARDWGQLSIERPIHTQTLIRQLAAAARAKTPSISPTQSKKILLFRGLKDQMVNPQCTLALQKYWNCERRDHPTAGHDLPLDEPEWLLLQLQDWINQS